MPSMEIQKCTGNPPASSDTTNAMGIGYDTVTGQVRVNDGTTAVPLLNGKQRVISGLGATRTLVAAESGSTVLFDRAAGIVVTLPAPVVGLQFNFLVSVTVTAASYKVITDAGSTFLVGGLVNIDTDTSNAVAAWTGNGTTHVAVTQAAAGTNATGGMIGTWLQFTCISATLWLVSGIIQGAGTVATPFATS